MLHVLAAITSIGLLCACTAVSGQGSTVPGSSDPPPAASSDDAPASLELPELETDFPPACEVVTSDELVAIVGNPLGDGGGFTSLICDWQSAAEGTSVSLLLQPVPAEFCSAGLPEGEATDQFGGEGAIGYSDSANVPGAQAGACVDAGLVLVTVTGAYRAPSDEARYTGEAVEVMELVLGRL
jgi:hypothetical protein